ncbi:hypothetical protein [Paenibacillus sp. N3.4]|uniref:hypothetical protein n=1 Tax=Paenibacillus sp. N3.4 TaxID=2603222 RepID=UPI0016502259|nr:hypothetical protein [Paenibacillus sp. N3.4]
MAEFTGSQSESEKITVSKQGLHARHTSDVLIHHSFGHTTIGVALVSLDGYSLDQ